MLIDIDTITIANAREGLVATTGDRVDLTIGQEEAPHHVVGNLRMTVAKIDQATTASALTTRRGVPRKRIPEATTRSQSADYLKVMRTAPFLKNWTVEMESWFRDRNSSGRMGDDPADW